MANVALAEFLAELDQLQAAAQSAFQSAADAEALEAARIEFLGAKSGRLKAAPLFATSFSWWFACT